MSDLVNARGHFSVVWKRSGSQIVNTTVTSQRKSRARELEAAKKAQLCAEIEAITGDPVRLISRSIDGVSRRWTGVKSNQADN